MSTTPLPQSDEIALWACVLHAAQTAQEHAIHGDEYDIAAVQKYIRELLAQLRPQPGYLRPVS